MSKAAQLTGEQELVASIAAGDKQAFHSIYEQTYGKVARYVGKLVADEILAEDVLVQTYTVAWQKMASFKGSSRLTTWLIGIARNIAFKEFRKNKFHEPFNETYIAADNTSHLLPEKKDREEKMKQALTALSANHREVLELVFYQGLTYPEVSTLINIPVNTVKTRVFHAKKALKETLRNREITADDI